MAELNPELARAAYEKALSRLVASRPELPSHIARNLIAFEIVEAMRKGEADVDALSRAAIGPFIDIAAETQSR